MENDQDEHKKQLFKNPLLAFYQEMSESNEMFSISVDPSPRCSISTRNSSIQLPIETCLLSRNSLMPPIERPTSSRLSTGSAWDSFRLSVVSFSKVFLFAPCSRHKCCLGCISLRDAVPLICVIEFFTIVFLTMVVLDIWVTDGKTFYTFFFEGYGSKIATGYGVFLTVSLPVLLITIYAWKSHKKYIYVVHVLWQWTVIEILVVFIFMVCHWVQISSGTNSNGILLPSAIVFIVSLTFGALIEFWWLFVFVDAMFFEKTLTERPLSSSISNKKISLRIRGDIESETSDSRQNSVIIPIVKIDRTQSIDCPKNNHPLVVSSSPSSSKEPRIEIV